MQSKGARLVLLVEGTSFCYHFFVAFEGVAVVLAAVYFYNEEGHYVVLEMFSDTGKIFDDGNAECFEFLGGANAVQEEETGRVDCAAADDDFFFAGCC